VSDHDLRRMGMEIPGSYPSGTVGSIARDLLAARLTLKPVIAAARTVKSAMDAVPEWPEGADDVPAGYARADANASEAWARYAAILDDTLGDPLVLLAALGCIQGVRP